ncbi:MAG: hypothetical protein RR162_08845 [Oscillospiraceae bacterium]
MDAQKKSNSALRGVILTFFELIVVLFINLRMGAIEQWFFPLPEAELDTVSNVSDWQTFDIPELTVSLKLPPGSHIYTRESLKQGNNYNDENFDWIIERFALPERCLVVKDNSTATTLSISCYNSKRFFFPNDYALFPRSRLDKLGAFYQSGTPDDHFWLKCNGNIYIGEFVPKGSERTYRHTYDTLKKGYNYWFTFLYDDEITDLQRSVQFSILQSLTFY